MSTRSPYGLNEYRINYRWTVVAATLLFLVLFYRFFLLQIVRGGEYRQTQVSSSSSTERLPARRGTIMDRNGVILAHNVPTHDLVMRPLSVRNPQKTEELLRNLLKLSDEEDEHLRELVRVALDQKHRHPEVTIRRDLVSDHCPFDSARLKSLEPKKKTLWCSQCGDSFEPIHGGARRCEHDHGKKLKWNDQRTGAMCAHGTQYVSGTACPHDGAALRERTWSQQCPVCARTFNNEKAVIEANLYRMRGLKVKTSLRRVYPYGKLMAHLVGYMNQVTQRDLDHFGEEYSPGDRIGRAGAERSFEEQLHGTWGARYTIADRPSEDSPIIERSDPDRPDVPLVDGVNIRLTIDVELQELLRQAMRYHRSGAAVVLHIETGQVLAAYSKPTFDPNVWSGRLSRDVYRAVTSSPYSPLLNKALTAYAPGSVYKLVTAVAALNEHLTNFRTEINCPGYFKYGGRKFRCHNRTGHGSLDLVHAMSRSCDIFFYQMGEQLGMDLMHDYAVRYFGFGLPTGIEIAESEGIVPTKAWHVERDGTWMPGFTVSTAVGQKDVRTTPLQIARSYAAFADGGKLKTSHIIKQIESADGEVLHAPSPRIVANLPLSEDELAGLAEGFWRAVNDENGTAFSSRIDTVEVSGKTGTAEAAESKPGVSEDVAIWLADDHAWFAGYAPTRKPEISVAVFLDHGGSGGKSAAPVAMKIIKGYFSRSHGSTISRDHLPNPIVGAGAQNQLTPEPTPTPTPNPTPNPNPPVHNH